MQRMKRKPWLSWVVAGALLLQIFLPLRLALAADVESILTNFVAQVSQNGVGIEEGGTLASGDAISIAISFDVPVLGDEPTPDLYVVKGDTATFALSDAFIVNPSDSIPLKMGDLTVGHVHFDTDPLTDMVSALVVFDGDDAVFDGTYHSVACRFSASFEYIDTGDAGKSGEHLVAILEKPYTVVVPEEEIVYAIEKSGTASLDSQSVEWTVVVSATQGAAAVDLGGLLFADDLGAVGSYLADSFTVGGVGATPTLDGNILTYTFVSPATSPQTITFKTAIPDTRYYGSGSQRIDNTARLYAGEDVVATDAAFVTFTPEWIHKSGTSSEGGSGVYDPTNRTVTWTITANQMGASLSNAVIADALPAGMTFVSAAYQSWDDSLGLWQSPPEKTWSTLPTDGRYELGDVNTPVLLTLVASVADEAYTAGVTRYYNSATLTWDDLPGTGILSNTANVGIGYNAIGKTGVVDTANRSVHWTVTVDTRGQTIPSLKVYDLLVYGASDSGFSFAQTAGYPAGLTPSDLVPHYNQQYVTDSFGGADDLVVQVHPITRDGVRVADLVEITGLSMTSPNTFTFDTLVTNPDIYAGNKTAQVSNTASLFSAYTPLNKASDQVDYISAVLAKEMLHRAAMADPAAGVNNKTTSTGSGFDYTEKAVIFRLSVNANALALSQMTNPAGLALGAVTVTDILPAGWVFTEIAPGQNYLIFAGTSGASASVTAASTTPLATVTGLTADFATPGQAAFTFPISTPPM